MSLPVLCSLDELQVEVQEDLQNHIKSFYEAHYRELRKSGQGPHNNSNSAADNTDADDYDYDNAAERHWTRLLKAMKTPPLTSIVRLNLILDSKEQALLSLNQSMSEWLSSRRRGGGGAEEEEPAKGRGMQFQSVVVAPHPVLSDVITVTVQGRDEEWPHITSAEQHRLPLKEKYSSSKYDPDSASCTSTRRRIQADWPLTHKVIICDRFCGEAVLRGSDIFVAGVLCADAGIQKGETVAVYSDIPLKKLKQPHSSSGGPTVTTRGLHVEDYTGKCVYLGLGIAACSRSEFFRSKSGTAILMSPLHRAGPVLPPLPCVPGMLQNLPSVVVGHVLCPQPNDMILDMCAAPGGKTSHLASLVRNKAVIVACDRSRAKMVSAKAVFDKLGATCIVPIAADSTRLVPEDNNGDRKTVAEIIASAETSDNGLLNVEHFFPESFDRILLDPPCSALGLRPKLHVEACLRSLESFARYQKRLIHSAVRLLKPGGILTYSTCTINTTENEWMVRHILDAHPAMRLERIDVPIGSPGLAGAGLGDWERSFVRRFDPADAETDTIGFFLAKFQKMPVP